MIKIVIDPDTDGRCYGKYERSPGNIPDNWSDVVEIDNLDDYSVAEWRYEDY